ncbi:sensor histidine kinase [Dyella sp. 2HG41-7]|uniref:sensor histidine kinase n=1 Tax=Dyella sp. 2HG41-7 TaxID=2883239 RepID=UPI001F490884|nr:sensor histidine kinase [Dyella sp. 2HG41-7]
MSDPSDGPRFYDAPRSDLKKHTSFAALRTRWRMGLSKPSLVNDIDRRKLRLNREIQERLGVLPNLFALPTTTTELAEELWLHAKAAYLDNPLPPLFKERLVVHLSRFCEMRYCVVRHAGFLLGRGAPAGDRSATPETLDAVLALLSRPVPNAVQLEDIYARLDAHPTPIDIPAPGTKAEEDLFDAITAIFLVPGRSSHARTVVSRAVGEACFENIMGLMVYIHSAHYWTELHPELTYEADVILLMAQHQDLARRLLDTADSEWVHAGDALREAIVGQLSVMNAELQHRTRNLLSVVHAIFARTASKHTNLENFSGVFLSRLNAIGRVQTYLSRLEQGDKVTFDDLLRTELAAHSVSLRQVTLDGPAGIRLRSTTLQTFALAIHELIVNALNYGALASPTAHLTVRWDVEQSDGQAPILHVHWQETGVECIQVFHTNVQQGYGMDLIEKALPYQLKAKTKYNLTPSGVQCSISVPVLA